MSDEINLETSNLCTTEDAFEQFQSASVYQEDEFITLSDITPVEDAAPDVSAGMVEIPYDNEVVLGSNLDEQVDINAASSAQLAELLPVNFSYNNTPDQLPTEEPSSSNLYAGSEDQSLTAKSKRGRKRNNAGNNSVTNIQQLDDGFDVQGNNVINNEQFSSLDLKPRGKRGRKPKNSQNPNGGQISLGNTSASELSQNPVTKGRRGRPRKNPFGDALANTASHRTNGNNRLSNELPNQSNKVLPLDSISKKGPGRRGRPKQAPSVIVEAVENADFEELIAPSEIDSCNMYMNKTIQKSPAKRGRERKGREGSTRSSNKKTGFGNEIQITHNSIEIKPGDDDDDDGDDISLSRLKATLDTDMGLESIETNVTSNIDDQRQATDDANTYVDVVDSENVSFNNTPTKKNDVPPELPDFKYDVDIVVGHTKTEHIDGQLCEEADDPNESFLVEDTSKRPIRRKIKQTLHYDDGSDEDPYANLELSDDEPRRKGKKYHSDDEYIPGGKKGKGSSSEDMSDSDIDDLETIGQLGKRKRNRNNSSQVKSPRKKGKKTDVPKNEEQPNLVTVTPNVTTIAPNVDGPDDDIEICLQSSVIKANDDSNKKGWSATNEFESFIAQKMHGSNVKIKKVSAGNSSQIIDIPVIDPNDAKKMVETSTQTNIQKTAVGVQTSTPYDLPMKKTVLLTAQQSEKACEFLKGVVKTTSELGQLMTQKSEDFLTKKINTNHVIDTMKMDYCVKKSFLLFKLAKHNLMQMEEDLSKQYDQFLKCNGLEKCREQPVKLEPKSKSADSDSDCEIVETPVPTIKKDTPKFNPKTVFLNKELSIKIAKKSAASEEAKTKEKLNAKGRHTVWISDSVMVKKVKPTQSFLAQDSRNKKPPDCYITEEMVSDFFKEYYRKQVQSVCAPFTSGHWYTMDKNYVCCYFFDKPDKFPSSSTAVPENDELCSNDVENVETSDTNEYLSGNNPSKESHKLSSPETLFLLCSQVLRNHMQPSNSVVNENVHYDNDAITDLKQQETPATLFRLCLNKLMNNTTIISNCDNLSNILQHDSDENDTLLDIFTVSPNISLPNVNHLQIEDNYYERKSFEDILSLKNICYRRITDLFLTKIEDISIFTKITNDTSQPTESSSDDNLYSCDEDIVAPLEMNYPDVTSLFSLCVKSIQRNQITLETGDFNIVEDNSPVKPTLHTPEYLKLIALENVKFYMNRNCHLEDDFSDSLAPMISTTGYKVKQLADICFEIVSEITNSDINSHNNKTTFGELTINSVNTMSEEAFLNIGDTCLEPEENSDYVDNEESNFFDDDDINTVFDVNRTEDNEYAEKQIEDNNWVSQVQMKELMSCFVPIRNSRDERLIPTDEENTVAPVDEQPIIARIKIEPFEEIAENVVDSILVKTEPVHQLNEMTVIPDCIVAKRENFDDLAVDPLPRQDSSGYDADTFESYVQSNKMMCALTEFSHTSDDIFSQSALRVRRQYDPDSDDETHENDSAMSLLVPQAFEPLHIETAKGNLMESSSDEGKEQNPRAKKKPERRRGRPKKTDTKQTSKDVLTKDKPPPVPPQPSINELARLTRRMRDKIRQAEKIDQSLDSDSENLPLNKRTGKEGEASKSTASKATEDEIQCNNVDSTEQFENSADKDKTFSGFTALDQNEISSYQKYVKFVYDKILPKVTADAEADKISLKPGAPNENIADKVDERSESPLINHDEPVEMLECVPTMPIFDDEDSEQPKKVRNKNKGRPKSKTVEKSAENHLNNDILRKDNPTFTEINGWHCYAVDMNDTKLRHDPGIFLEKLPESFVETYFRYQNVTDIRKEDVEVDRLINLQSLNRNTAMKEVKSKTKSKGKTATDEQVESELASGSRPASPAHSDNYAELTPSEDEHNVDDEEPPLVPLRPTSENNLAKNSLMNDNDSESEIQIKQEPSAEPPDATQSKATPKGRSKKTEEKSPTNPESLMLTADKMMNKELNLLHAPVILKHESVEAVDKATVAKKTKIRSKTSSTRDRIKMEEDSSSEEEKQWVSYKEKLLKKIGKKQDTSIEDDAKRAKIVSEFIERRGESSEPRRSGRGRGGGRGRRRITKRKLEREKQLRVLSKELYAENSADGTGARRVFSQSYFKGRRNIRKVLDKKSLARSTVIANMEEFERKCRLNERQSRLRDELGCEDDVNVLVINDEVCLEYDFEVQAPVVAVHPFFTKVMKAHQYEGVKFMWDACFESLEKIESGNPGGGCILAHCMGLGKTLQVLALLHTVLTHPRVGMQRVLVCCPLSTVLNWVDEIHKWIGPVTDNIKVFELSKLKKTYERAYQLEDWYNGGGIFIIGYELFRSLTTLDAVLDDIRPTIVKKIRMALLDPGPDIIVCDEGHLLKNDCSVLAVAMSRVQTRRRIVLTGTPMQNNLREYYCMVNFVKPNLLGTYSEYSNRFENPIMNGQHRDSQEEDIKLMKTRTHILHKVLEGCLQRQEASVLYPYLPKKHEYTVFVALTKCQWDLYKHYLQHYAKESKQSILKDFHTLQKIWSHPQVLHNFQMRTRDASGNKIKPEKMEDDLATEDLASEDIKPSGADLMWWQQYLDGGSMLDSLESSNKFVTVFRILDECVKLGDKVLIFSTSLVTMDSLEFFLKSIKQWSLGQEYYRLDGSLPPEVRQKWCRDFNAEHNLQTKVFLISTRAGSLGLNMVAANRVIILDTSWNPAHDIQSIFRVYRFGQKKDCYIYRLVALGTMEQKIYERSVTKQAVSCRVVDEQQIDRHYNMAELTELYGYDEAGVGVAGGVAVGVTDVALLRVARHAALHAVHEHDSLLRGSSEQGLPEDERAAAWMQFQQEHAHKQMQNQLTSSYMLQIPEMQSVHSKPPNLANIPLKQKNAASYTHPPEVKLEPSAKDTKPGPAPIKPRKGRPRKEQVQRQCRIPVQSEEPESEQPGQMPVSDEIVKKIMHLLIKHKFHDNDRSPRDIAHLVSNVRKIVAYGKVPKGHFDKELTESIANVLLGKEPSPPSPPSPPPPPPPALTDIEQPPRKRPGKRKHAINVPSTSAQADLLENLHHGETAPTEPEVKDGRRRRKAALRAEKHFDKITEDAAIDLDTDEDWHAGGDVESPPVAVPKAPIKEPLINVTKPPIKTYSKSKVSKANKQLNSDLCSILLSDDDEPVVLAKQPDNASTSVDVKPRIIHQEVTPLHPSLLSNKNFIKIVAHTYLEGNPMLDEDAATLAAQYSTQKALQEYESTGNTITSGPIYDIATKVLGIDILKKLYKTNPQLKPSTTAPAKRTEPQVKTEPVMETAKPAPPPKPPAPPPKPKVTAKGLSALLEKPSKPPPLGFGITTTRFAVAPSMGMSTAGPSVVPVGLFKRAGSILPDEPEESILPDDDDVRIVSDPTPAPETKPVIKKVRPTSQPAKADNAPLMPTIPAMKASLAKTIQINAGKITMVTPNPNVSTPQSHTICLDSDEEVLPEPVVAKKRVALKSTAKTQTPQVVPVSISAADIQPKQQYSTPTSYEEYLKQHHLPTLQNKNFVVIPASQLSKLTNLHNAGPAPPMMQRMTANETPQNVYSAPQNTYPTPQNTYPTPQNTYPTPQNTYPTPQNTYATPQNVYQIPQNMNFINSIPQNVNLMTSVPQNYNVATSMPQNVMSSMPQNTYAPMSQNYTTMQQNLINPAQQMNTIPGMGMVPQMNMQQMNSVQLTPKQLNDMNSMQMNATPQQATTSSESILPTNTPAPQKKTVCKPGDILRITSSGQVEILKRSDKAVEEPEADSSTHKKRTSKPKHPTKPSLAESRKSSSKKARMRVKSSSSSSSSDNSRPSSPADPLAILRDVVHIAAPEDANETSKSRSSRNEPSAKIDRTTYGEKDKLIGATVITRPEKTPTPSKATASSKPAVAKSSVTVAPTKDKVMKSSVLDKKPTQTTKTRSVYDSVDLTDWEEPSSSGVITKKTHEKPSSKPASQTDRKQASSKTDTKPASKTDRKQPSILKTDTKPASKTDRKQPSILKTETKLASKIDSKLPSTIVGTSKNIIISGSGKATSLLPKEQSARKSIRVTSVEKVAPGPAHKVWSDLKKRPSAVADTSAPKKKKTEPMTLKDFDIDDIDDIIELE